MKIALGQRTILAVPKQLMSPYISMIEFTCVIYENVMLRIEYFFHYYLFITFIHVHQLEHINIVQTYTFNHNQIEPYAVYMTRFTLLKPNCKEVCYLVLLISFWANVPKWERYVENDNFFISDVFNYILYVNQLIFIVLKIYIYIYQEQIIQFTYNTMYLIKQYYRKVC